MFSPIMCLVTAVFFEAGVESYAGKAAVAHVIMNRVRSSEYPDTVCDVVREGKYDPSSPHPLRYKCQFSYFCDGKSDVPEMSPAFHESVIVSAYVYSGLLPDFTHGATHYHAVYVQPEWADEEYKTLEIGSHLFYSRPR